jgi:hypothetical protein
MINTLQYIRQNCAIEDERLVDKWYVLETPSTYHIRHITSTFFIDMGNSLYTNMISYQLHKESGVLTQDPTEKASIGYLMDEFDNYSAYTITNSQAKLMLL